MTALPPAILKKQAASLPVVNNPSYYANYFSNASVLSSHSASSGYSSSHLCYAEECERWLNTAYKPGQLPISVQTKENVPILMCVSYQMLAEKIGKTVRLLKLNSKLLK